jgi:hypothetical protein
LLKKFGNIDIFLLIQDQHYSKEIQKKQQSLEKLKQSCELKEKDIIQKKIMNKSETIQEGLQIPQISQQSLMTPEPPSQMMVTPGDGVILVEEPDILKLFIMNHKNKN